MEHIQINKSKIFYLAKILKKEFPDLEMSLKLENKNKKIYLKIKGKPNLEIIKKIEAIIKLNFEDYSLNILVY